MTKILQRASNTVCYTALKNLMLVTGVQAFTKITSFDTSAHTVSNIPRSVGGMQEDTHFNEHLHIIFTPANIKNERCLLPPCRKGKVAYMSQSTFLNKSRCLRRNAWWILLILANNSTAGISERNFVNHNTHSKHWEVNFLDFHTALIYLKKIKESNDPAEEFILDFLKWTNLAKGLHWVKIRSPNHLFSPLPYNS